uniref:Putative ovule protein n=1 Tax=Solanum chacoense TaxID=4108 RepID=A0A0V0IED8_SOLCH
MSPPPSLLPSPPPQLLLLPPPQPLVTSEDESRNKSDLENIDESDEELDEDVEESGEEWVDEEDSDSVCSEPLSPRSDDSYDNPSIEELIEELYTPILPGEEKKDREFWKRYFQQVRESEGFDIKDYPGSCPITSIYPMTNYLDTPANVEMLKGYCAKALEQYNTNNGTKYEVDRILKVNEGGCQGFIFYITFSVKNGEDEYFQAKVVEHINKSLEFPIVRPRVKGGLDI